jgi:Tfp pilus assembly PilM family ATPase
MSFLNGFQHELAGIEIGAAALKLVCFKPGAKEVAGIAARDIKGLSDDEIVKALAAAFKELGCRNPSVALIVPSPIVISKNIEVPSVDSRELREIINLQAARHTPFSREEIIIDYIPIGTYKQNYTKILLLIVTSAAIKKQIMLLEKAGIRAEKVLLCQEGLGFFAGKAAKAEAGIPYGFLHIDDSSTDFSALVRNKVLFIRSIPIGRQQLAAEKEKAVGKFVEEVRRSLETYHTECIDKDIQALFCAGALDELEHIDLALAAETNLPVTAIPYWNSFALSAKVRSQLASQHVSFLDVLAPLEAFSECKVDLLPDEIRLKRLLRERGMDLFTGGILLLSTLVLLLFIALGRLYFKNEYLKALEARFRTLAGDARAVEDVFQQNSLIRSYLASRGVSVKVLGELHELTPVNIGLSDIRFDREGKFTVRGTSDSMSTVFAFVDQMEKSKVFRDVKTKYTTKRQEGKKDVTDFEINALVGKVTE